MKHLLLLVFMLPAFMFAAVLNYTIDNSGLSYSYETNRFDSELGSEWVYTTAPGSFRLPVRVVNIILPASAEVINTNFTISRNKLLPGLPPQLNTPYANSERVLNSQPALQPNQHVIYQGTGRWADVVYARFSILPALFDTNTNSYEIAEQINLSISYNLTSDLADRKANIPPLLSRDSSFINKNMLDTWYQPNRNRNYDYLVITTPELFAAAQPLVTFRQSQGLITAFADINQIMTTSSGINPVEKLRNHLILEYVTAPYTYLLLIGDTDLIPIAHLTPEPNGNETVPSDFYYSDLSSDFDSDNDGRLGEYDSGMDFTPELFVGRIPWNDTASVSQICTRIAAFDAEDFAWKRKALLPAAMLNYASEETGFERTDGATFMEYCKSNILRDYQTTTLYEQAGLLPSYPSDYTLQADTLANLISNQSWGIVSWSAHGSPTSTARKVWMNDWNNNNIPEPQELNWFSLINLSTFNNLSNQDGSVYFCASCNNGMLDYTQTSLGEWLILKKAVAGIAATRTGWYKIGWENPGWGGLSSYNYHFLENYARHGMTVGQAHAYANWLHTQYCLFGDPVDSGGIIWPELQNVYTYLLFGDPAVGYPAQVNAPGASILVWEPIGDTGTTVINGLLDLAPFNVAYSRYLIDSYNYLPQFDAVFCLFGFGQDSYSLTPDSLSYGYLLDYLQQGGKVYLEGMVNWDPADSLYGRFGTTAPFDHVAYIEQLRYTNGETTQIWDYDGYNEGTPALETYGQVAQSLFYSYNQEHVNDVIGIWNRIGESRTISSSFNLSGVYSDIYSYPQFLGIILDTLDVYQLTSVPVSDDSNVKPVLDLAAYPNPFTGSITVAAKSDKPAKLNIYNIKGQLVKTDTLFPENGKISWQWDGKSSGGRKLAAGIYLLKLDNGHGRKVIKALKLD